MDGSIGTSNRQYLGALLRVAVVNVRGISKKLAKVNGVLRKYGLDLLILTETRATKEIQPPIGYEKV